MKPRIALSVLFVLMAATAWAADTPAAQSDAQKSFDKLKALAGTWEGAFEGHHLRSQASCHFHGERAYA